MSHFLIIESVKQNLFVKVTTKLFTMHFLEQCLSFKKTNFQHTDNFKKPEICSLQPVGIKKLSTNSLSIMLKTYCRKKVDLLEFPSLLFEIPQVINKTNVDNVEKSPVYEKIHFSVF